MRRRVDWKKAVNEMINSKVLFSSNGPVFNLHFNNSPRDFVLPLQSCPHFFRSCEFNCLEILNLNNVGSAWQVLELE